MTFIVQPAEADQIERVGGKAFALACLQRAGLPVPAWFALSPVAFDASMTSAQRRALEAPIDEPILQTWIAEITPGDAVRYELAQALADLCPAGERVAVRSSAIEEDGIQQSFAGQFDSFLNVAHDKVVARVAAVWHSGFSARLLAYR